MSLHDTMLWNAMPFKPVTSVRHLHGKSNVCFLDCTTVSSTDSQDCQVGLPSSVGGVDPNIDRGCQMWGYPSPPEGAAHTTSCHQDSGIQEACAW